MERKSLHQEITEEVAPYEYHAKEMPIWGIALCRVLDRRLKALERPEAQETPGRPELLPGDVVRFAGHRHGHLLRILIGPQLWEAFDLSNMDSDSTLRVNVAHAVEVYRAGKLLWRLPEPEGGYRDE